MTKTKKMFRMLLKTTVRMVFASLGGMKVKFHSQGTCLDQNHGSLNVYIICVDRKSLYVFQLCIKMTCAKVPPTKKCVTKTISLILSLLHFFFSIFSCFINNKQQFFRRRVFPVKPRPILPTLKRQMTCLFHFCEIVDYRYSQPIQ